jgi:single-stranded-DNA-specific exonuclease
VTDDDFALVFSGKDWHRGVVGIVASRLVERFHRPAFVMSEDLETGQASGSGRSVPAFHLLEALETMPELFVKFGGHRQAAGLTMLNTDVEGFRQRLNTYASGKLIADDFRKVFEIDAILSWTELNELSVTQIHSLAPFGLGNCEPCFVVLDAEVASPPGVLKEKHLRVAVRQNGRTLLLKAWNFAERIDELQPGTRLDLVVCVEEDAYSASRGYPNWCVVLKDVRPAAGAIIT